MIKCEFCKIKEAKGRKKRFCSHLCYWKSLKGKQLSDKAKEKCRQKNIGNKYLLGKKQSEETKQKKNLKIKGQKRSKEVIMKISGENSWNWIKDRTKLKKSENKMNDYSYQFWVKQVRIRDKNNCRLLSIECKGRLETHHIFDWKNYPELRYIVNNGITLCAFHHPRGREKEKRMIPILQELLSVSKE